MNKKSGNEKKELSRIEQISGTLAEEIRSGKLPAGKKLPGERKLSIRFDASRGTINEALNLLARKNLIERVPQSGSYVMPQYRRFALVFPGTYTALPTPTAWESWQIVSELFRGALQEATNNNAEAVLVCFEEENDKVKLQNQLRRLHSFDAVFFLVYDQMKALRNALKKEKFPYTRLADIMDNASNPEVLSRPDLEYNFRLMCQKIKAKGYRNIFLTTKRKKTDEQEPKLDLFQHFAAENGLKTKIIRCDSFPKEFLTGLKSGIDAIYCENTESIQTIYQAAEECGLVPGKSFGLTAYASGQTFINLKPAVSYLKINHHMIGVYAIRKLNEILDGQAPAPEFIEGDFIDGETL
ncbi:MAG: GntR family transcriptional regulator [Lentisphaerae bacterium]|nr:GntR family transcriptional regulator [Lentisphaerota bacterium]